MPNLVETHSLCKHYAQFAALQDCTFSVPQGEVCGLLGPNGAGKSTLIRLLLGFLKPTSGGATINGLDCYRDATAAHAAVAYLPGDVRLFRTLRGREVLRFFAKVRPGGRLDKAEGLCERLGLDPGRAVATMSTGMRQKLALAAILSMDTPLIILDEPTSNLDPTIRGVVSAMVREAQAAGRTVLFSSHVLSEVEQTCDRVLLLRAGRIVFEQRIADLRLRHRIQAVLQGELPLIPAAVQDHLVQVRRDQTTVVWETTGELVPLLGWLATLALAEIQIEPIGLQTVYERFHSSEHP
ncbi:MAG TPA: ABC transporter ATP-binding protein [Pirellulales bacterium]|nr:ABC transporter ATP-binding protein [Pirellulales bacterium]